MCYDYIGESQRAIAAYRNVIRYKQDDAQTHIDLAKNLMKNGNYREAEKEYQLAIDILEQGPKDKEQDAFDKEQKARNKGQETASGKEKKKKPKATVKKERRTKNKKESKKKEQEKAVQQQENSSQQQPATTKKDNEANTASLLAEARQGLEDAQVAAQIKQAGSRYIVKKAEQFNSRRADYSPMYFGTQNEQLFWTDELSGITGCKPGDIFYAEKDDKGKWGKPQTIESGLNSELDEGTPSFSVDGREMYLGESPRSWKSHATPSRAMPTLPSRPTATGSTSRVICQAEKAEKTSGECASSAAIWEEWKISERPSTPQATRCSQPSGLTATSISRATATAV